MSEKTIPADEDVHDVAEEAVWYAEWMESKEIIKTMLRELRPDLNEESHDHNAAAIIARLAHANLLIHKEDIR